MALKFNVKIRLLRNESNYKSSFGPGPASLLRGVKNTHSLNKSAKSMGMAYSKAWKILNNAEKELGFCLIERKVPGGSTLTKKGEALLELYDRLEQAAQEAIQEVLDQSNFIL